MFTDKMTSYVNSWNFLKTILNMLYLATLAN